MSKKFPKIKARVGDYIGKTCALPPILVAQDLVILDLDWGDGKNFLTQCQQWLGLKKTKHTMVYYAVLTEPAITFALDDSQLAQGLKKKWPPLWYGMHLLDFPDLKIRLHLIFKDAINAVEGLLQHHDAIVDRRFRPWSLDRIILKSSVDGRLGQLLHQLMTNKTLILGGKIAKVEGNEQRLKNSPWPLAANRPKHSHKTIHIIGAGLAGAYFARLMADEGWKVMVYEARASAASLGSGNRYSVLYPKLSIYQAPFTEILMQSYPYAYAVWSSYLQAYPDLGFVCPLTQSTQHDDTALFDYLAESPQWFSPQSAANPGFVAHHSMVIDMPKLCQYLLAAENIEVVYQHRCKETFPDGLTVWAAGYESPLLGLKGMRGQMSHIKQCYAEQMIYCQQGHILPAIDGVHAVGASYNPRWQDLSPCAQDDVLNLVPWEKNFGSLQLLGNWVGVRTVSKDHLPLVGWLPDEATFVQRFSRWRHHADWVMTEAMPNQSCLAFSGFGSRGLVSIPLMAKVLQGLILDTPPFIPNPLLQAISPARFLRKQMSKDQSSCP